MARTIDYIYSPTIFSHCTRGIAAAYAIGMELPPAVG